MNSPRTKFSVVLLLFTLAVSAQLRSQVGNNNPTGPAGEFNGNVTTGCSYDPYTGNMTRTITDMVVAGAVGKYGLSYSRTWNSRDPDTLHGAWTSNYSWSIDSLEDMPPYTYTPLTYTVHFPDGRTEVFYGTGSNPLPGGPGIRERMQPYNGSICSLILPDGGKIEFRVTKTLYNDPELIPPTWCSYDFQVQAIIDPYGQRTTYTYNPDGSATITEPAGRWIKIFSDHIQASDGRQVQYTYTSGALTGVTYYGDNSLRATYTYANGLLKTCDDPMYAGPMKRIGYVYKTGTNTDGSTPVAGQILSENYYDGINPNNLVPVLTTLDITTANTRTETRADGKTRTFTYDESGFLTSVTDFKGVSLSEAYDSNGYVNAVTDRNGHTTNFTNNSIGAVTQIQYALTPGDTVPANAPRGTVTYTYGWVGCPDPNNQNAYYLYSITDEGGHAMILTRDTSKRVTRIGYPDGGFETFAYNTFGQILTHRLTSGGTEAWEYDASGKPTKYRDPYHDPIGKTGNPTFTYVCDATTSRLTSITEYDHSGAACTTSYTYNSRGQVTGMTNPDSSYVQRAYNVDGTLAWVADELHPNAATDATQRTSYEYDDYKRLRRIITPLRFTGDTASRTGNVFYDANGVGEDYSRTVPNVTWSVTPNNRSVHATYDNNYRKLTVISAPGTGDEATNTYDYDNAGNLTTLKTPNQQTGGPNAGTSYAYWYDERNRLSDVDDPISTDRNSAGHTISYKYNAAGNRSQQIRADNQLYQWAYDSMNRVTQTTGSAGETTGYQFDSAGNVLQITDANTHVYSFTYDYLNRKKTATYPLDANNGTRSETYIYDLANHLYQYVKADGQTTKTFNYDNRGRLHQTLWSSNGPTVTIDYDSASNVNTLTRVLGNDTVTTALTYDSANNKIFETQSVNGLGHIVQTHLDPDGNRSDFFVNTGGAINGNQITGGTMNYGQTYEYTGRNQLKNINDQAGAQFFHYDYDFDGNVTKRTGIRANDPMGLSYDALDRPTLCWQAGTNGDQTSAFATSHYQYDKLGNIQDTYRDEQAGKGERYSYDLTNQLTAVSYNADGVQTSSPTNASRTVSYTCDTINRTNMTDSSASPSSVAYTPNALNQYTSVGGVSLSYNNNFNLTSYGSISNASYDPDDRLVSITNGTHSGQFLYDALGRCVKRTIDGTSIVFTYDGWSPVAEWNSSGNLTASNFYGIGSDEILSRILSDGTQYLYRSDPMGNIMFLLQNISNVATGVEKYTYDAFGGSAITDWSGNSRAESTYNRFMFTGREYLAKLGIYDYRNRAYHPGLGRFLQTDPSGFAAGDPNLYRYCGNNPIGRSDPSGLGNNDQKIYKKDNVSSGGTDPWQYGTTPSVGQGLTLQGWWSSPSGLLTNVPGGQLNAAGAPGGGRDAVGAIIITGYHAVPATEGVHVEGWFLYFPPIMGSGDFGLSVGMGVTLQPMISLGNDPYWRRMLVTAYNDRTGDHDNRLGKGDVATGDRRYNSSDFDKQNNLLRSYKGTPDRALERGTATEIYRRDGSIYNGTVTDTGAGFAAHRLDMGLPNGVPAEYWLDIWTRTGSENPEWDWVFIQPPGH